MIERGHISHVFGNAQFRQDFDFLHSTAITNSPERLAAWGRRLRLFVLLLALPLSTLAVFSLVSVAAAQSIYSEAYTFTTFAGQSSIGSADGAGSDARFNYPEGVAVDSAGNVYVADSGNSTIRKITSAGGVSTIAGFAGITGSADGTNSDARFWNPEGVAVDGAGNVYVADSFNSTIRKLTPVGTNWVVTTLAGGFSKPGGVTVDSAGNLYVADTLSDTIRKMTPVGTNWVVSTLAGTPYISGTNDGTGTNAQFFWPSGVAVDSAGNVYVADSWNQTIRKVTPAGVVTTLAGNASITDYYDNPVGGYADGAGSAARFNYPRGVAVDSATNLYVADAGNDMIRKVTLAGTNWMVTSLAGLASSAGCVDGTGSAARFNYPEGAAVDNNGNVCVADTGNATIRIITSAAFVSTIAGTGADSGGSANGTGGAAQFNSPVCVAVDSATNLYVTDTGNNTIRKITPLAVVSTIAGFAGISGSADGVGSSAQFDQPYGIAVDNAGNVYVADTGNNTIRKISSAGAVSTIAGIAGISGSADATNSAAQFHYPEGLAADSATNLYVTDTGNNTIRKVTPVGTNWVVSTIAGLAGNCGSADGIGSAARFYYPEGIAVDSAGNLYVADTFNDTIRKVTPVGTNWVVSTIAGVVDYGNSGFNDGTGTNAQFFFPWGVAVDSATNLYVADRGNELMRKITPAGMVWVVSTIAGGEESRGSADGAGNAARFYCPQGVAVDNAGNVYVADMDNNTIRKGVFTQYTPANPVPFAQPTNNAILVVTLLPAEANGQWRFPWEPAWRQSGTAAANLAPNQNYPVEFSPVPGYLAIPAEETVYVGGGQTNYVTNQYYPTITSLGTNSGGSLEVLFQVNAPCGAGWRLLGDTNAFLPSGFATNLLPGNYLIEFAALSNFTQIPIQSVQISAGMPTVVQEIYQPAQPAPSGFLLPVPVPSGEISDLTDYPYGYSGQLETDVGYGSGAAVEANVVLTAAHLVFNDQTLSYVSQAWWYFQEEAPQFVPEPQAAQGWLVLSGYASQRTNDLQSGFYTADESSPQSRNFDVAALYFQSPVAGGGYGGCLPSDATPNSWLTSTAEKMLVGYPVDGSMFQVPGVVPGQMYEIGPQPYPLSPATDPVNDQQVYTASWFISYPGNSGGPFYVEFDGYYYPAGVYLGTLFSGTVPYASAVRAIDSNVVNLITNAQALVTTGTNNSGGGVVTINAGSGIASNPGAVEVTISPPAVLQAGGAWKLSTLSDAYYSVANPSAFAVTSAGSVQLQFKQVSGWNLPANQSVAVAAGTVVNVASSYTLAMSWPTPAAITYGTPLGSGQLNATTVITPAIPGTPAYSPSAGTVLSAGTHTLSVTFTPGNTNYGGVTTTNVSLTVMQAAPVLTWGNPASLIAGTPLSSNQLNATANVPGNYAYNPTNGTILSAGTHTLSVTFTPNDTVDYTGATRSVSLTVIAPAPPVIQTAKQSGGSFTFTWSALTNQIYQIQSTANLAQTNWTSLGSVTATNPTMTVSEPTGSNSQQFFRVVLVP
jgi:sugar lactone lactonase YvrE